MSQAYKKFTAQDKAIVPFNAHKQYNYNSGSAATNKVTYFATKWTSESISRHSSASINSLGIFDPINAIKYRQIDHLFYSNFKTDSYNRFDNFNYLHQKRELHQNANIISIPTGLYGYEIKPGSFYLSSSNFKITDDYREGLGAYGNLIISGTLIDNYPIDIRNNVFRLDPIKGFEKYNLDIYKDYALKFLDPLHPEIGAYKVFYKKGREITNAPKTYSTKRNISSSLSDIPEKDDSYYLNPFSYNNMEFATSSLGSSGSAGNEYGKFSSLKFNSKTGSFVVREHDVKFDFSKEDDFAISFWMEPEGRSGPAVNSYIDKKKRYIISKSTTKTIIPPPLQGKNQPLNTTVSGNMQPRDVDINGGYPFEIYMESQSLYFNRSDGSQINSINCIVTGSEGHVTSSNHILCQKSGSTSEIYLNGNLIVQGTENFTGTTQNLANLYIGSKGTLSGTDNAGGIGTSAVGSSFILGTYGNENYSSSYFNGKLSHINIWDKYYNSETIKNISESINASPYIGNIFYRSGFGVITHPKYQTALNSYGVGVMKVGSTFIVGNNNEHGINKLQFQATHQIKEHEYQCTIDEHEFNSTTNVSARKDQSTQNNELSNFTTSSIFKPYITTIGLYNELGDLLVVGKLGSPIKTSNETDTTFVVRWDT